MSPDTTDVDAGAPREAVADYARVAAAIRFLEGNFREQPRLEDVAAHLHLSPFHLQRVFQRWAGVSPKRLLQLLTVQHAKSLLAADVPVLDAALESGLSGPGRLHDLFVALEAMTPGEYGRGGEGLEIRHGTHDTPFGRAVIATTARGICGLAFCDPESEDAVLADLRARWPGARWIRDRATTAPIAARVFEDAARSSATGPLAVLVHGTNFQVQVWQALLRVPAGRATTYEAVATAIGRPAAIRAAASAIGDNPVAWLIPCHRVLRKSGALGGYRWGTPRKRAILAWEGAHVARS